MFPLITFDEIGLDEANRCLNEWGHKMGVLHRGNQGAICHGLAHLGEVVAVTCASNLISPHVGGGCDWLKRENTVELSRLCASKPGLCRVALRLWREYVFTALPYEYAMSYQDADLHSGNTYRFDGWKKVGGMAKSGKDTRSGREGRNKIVWQWPA
jgi:antitoxin VapB